MDAFPLSEVRPANYCGEALEIYCLSRQDRPSACCGGGRVTGFVTMQKGLLQASKGKHQPLFYAEKPVQPTVIALQGHSPAQAPQSMHSSAFIPGPTQGEG